MSSNESGHGSGGFRDPQITRVHFETKLLRTCSYLFIYRSKDKKKFPSKLYGVSRSLLKFTLT